MKLITPWLLTWCCVFTTSAYQLSFPVSPVSTGLGGCHTACPGSTAPAGRVESTVRLSANAAAHNSYGVPELSHLQAGLYYKTPPVVIGLTAQHFGFGGYGETAVGLDVGRKFSPHWSAALRGWWVRVAWPTDEKPVHTGLLEAEVLVHPHQRLTLGLHVFNLSFTRYRVRDGKLFLPVHFRLGVCYRFAGQWALSVEGEKELYGPPGVHAGCQYAVARRVELRLGLEARSGISPTGGIGVRFKHFQCDLGIQYHWKLGVQSSVGIQYLWP